MLGVRPGEDALRPLAISGQPGRANRPHSNRLSRLHGRTGWPVARTLAHVPPHSTSMPLTAHGHLIASTALARLLRPDRGPGGLGDLGGGEAELLDQGLGGAALAELVADVDVAN